MIEFLVYCERSTNSPPKRISDLANIFFGDGMDAWIIAERTSQHNEPTWLIILVIDMFEIENHILEL